MLPRKGISGEAAAIMFDDMDLTAIQHENTCQLILRLLNLIEKLSADLRDAQAESQLAR